MHTDTGKIYSSIMCECNGGTFSDHDIFAEDETCNDVVSVTADQEKFCYNLGSVS